MRTWVLLFLVIGLVILAVALVIAIGMGSKPLPEGVSADKIVVEKAARKLTLFSDGKALKTYRIALGGDPEGPKEKQGDAKTPEGTYIIDYRNPQSKYHLSLHISYPSPSDASGARKLGVNPGGDIMIHGLPEGFGWLGHYRRYKALKWLERFHYFADWTQGCIAVTNSEIEEIWRACPNGTQITIEP